MAECQLPKLNTGVRFPSPAPSRSKRLSFAPTYFISQSALILLLLLSKSQPLRWVAIWTKEKNIQNIASFLERLRFAAQIARLRRVLFESGENPAKGVLRKDAFLALCF